MKFTEVLCVRVLILVQIFIDVSHGARILGIFPTPSISHQVVYSALMKTLALRGHELLVITPNPIRDPNIKNYTEIDLSFTYDYWRKRHNFAAVKDQSVTPEELLSGLLETSYDLCEMELDHPDVKSLISSEGNGFDLIFIEWLIYPCFCGFSYKFSAPIIGISSLGIFPSGHDSVGNPTHPVYTPDILQPYTDHMTYYERFRTVFYFLYFRYKWHFHALPTQDAIARQYFGDGMPYLGEIENNVSMVFMNSHFSLHYPRPNVPAVIEMGGMHLQEVNPLPQELQQYLDGATAGALYMSLGSNVLSSSLPPPKLQEIMGAFRSLPHLRVLWKWEADGIQDQPRNVKLVKWLPQRDILAHPHVRVFISQGGQQSLEEAVHCGVPMVGIPFFADQDLNVKKAVSAGAAVHLDFDALTSETLAAAINTVLENNSYRANTERLSVLIRDQPETPMARAVWWTEYVLRHRGARHLRSAALELRWYQYLLLDVFLGVGVAALAVLALAVAVARAVAWATRRSLAPEAHKTDTIKLFGLEM